MAVAQTPSYTCNHNVSGWWSLPMPMPSALLTVSSTGASFSWPHFQGVGVPCRCASPVSSWCYAFLLFQHWDMHAHCNGKLLIGIATVSYSSPKHRSIKKRDSFVYSGPPVAQAQQRKWGYSLERIPGQLPPNVWSWCSASCPYS